LAKICVLAEPGCMPFISSTFIKNSLNPNESLRTIENPLLLPLMDIPYKIMRQYLKPGVIQFQKMGELFKMLTYYCCYSSLTVQ